MQCASALRLYLLIALSLSLTLAQNKEELPKNPYGIAFSLEDGATISSQRITVTGSVPGEGVKVSESGESTTSTVNATTISPSTEESPVTVRVAPNEVKKDEKNDEDKDEAAFMIAKDDDDDKSSEGDDGQNPRLVFIERLMGLHLGASKEEGEEKDDETKKEEDSDNDSEVPFPFKNPSDNVNDKWAARMRKFTVPLQQQQQQQQVTSPEQANPLLRYAAAAMMTRLLTAAARANQGEPMMGKDKDDNDNDEETVPVLLATMRDNEEPRGGASPMYGRPMLRPQLRSPMMNYQLAQQARIGSHSVPQRMYSSHSPSHMSPSMIGRQSVPPLQPVVIMLAHVPMQPAESRMGPSIAVSPYSPSHQPSSYYQPIPFSSSPMGYHSMPRQVIPVEIPVPVHVPVPMASYHRPIYQSPYQAYQHESAYSPVQRQDLSPAFSQARPVIEVPIEIPINVPFHSIKSAHSPIMMNLNNDQDQDTSASQAEQVAIVYYDPEAQDQDDPNEPHIAESNQNVFKIPPNTPKHFPFLSRPLPDNHSPGKIKLWREFVNEKHSSQPGVRYIPVAVETQTERDTSANENVQSPLQQQQQQQQGETVESQTQPAFVILENDENNNQDEPTQEGQK